MIGESWAGRMGSMGLTVVRVGGLKKEKNDRLGFIKIKNFCVMSYIAKRITGQATFRTKYSQNKHLINDL